LLQILSNVLRIWKPPFPLFVITFGITSLGQAYQDTHANTFVAGAHAAHRWLGFIHAMYMAGCLVGPFIATAIASSTPSQWGLFYVVPLGLGIINLGLVNVAFWDMVKLNWRPEVSQDANPSAHHPPASEEQTNPSQAATALIKATFSIPSFWLLSLFYFFYLGAAVTAGGWVVEFLVVVRRGELSQIGYVAAAFSGGGFLGRLLLAEPTNRFGEKPMVFTYCTFCVGLQVLFWLYVTLSNRFCAESKFVYRVPNIIAASLAISFIGFFSGPLFAAVSIAS
jgi:fucose permease